MQTRHGWSVFASLMVLATMVLPVGLAAATAVATEAQAAAPLAGGPMQHPGTATVVPMYRLGISKLTSTNWAGYVDYDKTKGQITEAFAEWKIPKATCPASTPGASYQVQWVGIDGFNSGTVEQLGTYDYCSGPGASPFYEAWYEFYPAESVQGAHVAAAGDLVEAYVLYNPTLKIGSVTGTYILTLWDSTGGFGFEVVGNPDAGPDVSAECISEAPGNSGGSIYPLTDYKSTTFITCDATIAGKFTGIGAYSTVYEVNQVDGSGQTVQSTGALSTTDYASDHFTITWKVFT